MSQAVGVLILDEPQDLSATVRATLEHLPVLHTVGQEDIAASGPEGKVALLVLDERRLPDALALLASLRDRWPALRVLVAFQALAGDDLRALLAAGADAFVARSASAQQIGAAILALSEDAPCLLPEPPEETGDGLGLTPREAEILRFLSSGFSNKEVARRLTLSVRTVETHRLNLRRKTQTGRLKDLVSLARQLGLEPVVDGETGGARH
ncbi:MULTISPECIES: response regulator transcription factor [Methylobacterium]|uniref:DNA-binding response regulator n=2 Tax=Pseudomonadota TaxID=1224 RepID=A0ABQ4SZX7_9HYPH|nr:MULTISPECIES: response regulator transcription factor [Methylobacterium]PIU06182.1 MAG: DNA-binding response regulator [Methylobacterium sp. CG09_land_8_20_14_0_10_71_15]PIU14473.1 MAG: DNA-binding response regulator [Methylobacterium sp. CG08_land_8_20_14_0_20_71_15]GBU18232.1 hypothetical protein AwMethylo_24470 [Methylobacterium sp.]GJE08104.1 hypothetical protein AOPFMNJM_3438 [Methylobacterium jeotgali]